MLMKTTKQNRKETSEVSDLIAFRPSVGAKTAFKKWDETGYGRSVFINTVLSKFGEQAAKELPQLLEQVGISRRRKVVRGKGIEPLTPTVSM